MTAEQIEVIESMAGSNFAPSDIAIYLGIDVKVFLADYDIEGSEVQQAYYRGQLQSKFLVINKQKDLAETGNITAAQIFLKESEKIEAKNILNKVLYG